MATSRSGKSGSTGLRIVWIPGKKKQPKGSYNPTKKGNLSGYHQQKKIEPWSMGGSKGQEDLLKAEIPGADMASPSIVNCLPQTLGISAACSDKPPEGAEGGPPPAGVENGAVAKGDPQEAAGASSNNIPPQQPLSPRLGPLANIDEDEHENDFDDLKDDGTYAANSNTATLLLKDRKMTKNILPAAGDDDVKKEPLKDMADGVPHMRGLNRKQTIERRYREQDIDKGDPKKKGKEKDGKSGLNEKAVDCLYFGLMCCECTIQ